jgi:predicted hydrocarbon binding protein
VRWRGDTGAIDVRGSLFCEVRERAEQPLCEFYASAIRRVLLLLNVDADIGISTCRATGAGQCVMTVTIRQMAGLAA